MLEKTPKIPVTLGTLLSPGPTRELWKLGLAQEKEDQPSCLEGKGGNGPQPPSLLTVQGEDKGTHTPAPLLWPLCSSSCVLQVLLPSSNEHSCACWRRVWISLRATSLFSCSLKSQLELGARSPCLGQKIWPIAAL